MHIAIDAHMVGEQETGNETYIINLVRALLRAVPEGSAAGELMAQGSPPQLSLLTPHPEHLQAALPALPSQARVLQVRPGHALLRIPLVMPWMAARREFDLIHVTYNAPPLCPCAIVDTIHDISFERYPQFFSPRDLAVLKTLVPLSARRADRVITVSRHAKQEIVDRYGISPDQVVVTYEAAGEQYRPVTDGAALQAVRRKYGLGDSALALALGNLQPRKNIGRLVAAFADVVHSLSAGAAGDPAAPGATGVRLVIAGKAQWRGSEVYRTVAEAGLQDAVVFPGYIEGQDLPALFSAATVFVFPSLYEGFGLPPLEAMACGTPVICSRAASLPEVVGDAALTFDPTSTDALAQALHRVLTDAGLRDDLQSRGLRRAGQFSWDRCAAETLAVYREAIEVRSH